jgi:Holliday junction resolvasome RuvABC ATP-dependent DNA helicase subunit
MSQDTAGQVGSELAFDPGRLATAAFVYVVGPKADTMTVRMESLTLVGATTRFGLVTAPMRSPFGIVQRLTFYPADELATIVGRSAVSSL